MEAFNSATEDSDSEDTSSLSRDGSTPSSMKSAETDVEEGSLNGGHMETPLSMFDRVTSELLKIGAIPLERFATEDHPEEENAVFPDAHLLKIKEAASQSIEGSGSANGRRKEHFQAVAKIYEACMRTFENSEAINFDFKNDSGPNGKASLSIHQRRLTKPCYSQLANASSPLLGRMGGVGLTLLERSFQAKATLRPGLLPWRWTWVSSTSSSTVM